jgi:hypothetical protein
LSWSKISQSFGFGADQPATEGRTRATQWRQQGQLALRVERGSQQVCDVGEAMMLSFFVWEA